MMFTRPQARTSLLIVLAALAALLTVAILLATRSHTLTAQRSTESTEVAARQIVDPYPRSRFAPLGGRRTPAPVANLEAPLSGRRTPAPLANLEAPLGGRRTPAPVANLEAPLSGRRTPAPMADLEAPLGSRGSSAPLKVSGSALYVLGTGAIVLIGALRERLNRR